jgi:hypothetical protein
MGLLKIYDNNGKLIEVKEIEGQDVSVIREQDIVKPKSRVLVVGDLHEPFSHAKYLDFCIDTYNNFNCNKVVFIGDLIDNHATSNWGSDPEGRGVADELELAVEKLKLWYKQFPEATVTLGNHDIRPFKKAFKAGLPSKWLKGFNELIEAPKRWRFVERIFIDGVLYEHGTQSGDMAAVNVARNHRCSVVVGHGHSFSGVRYLSSSVNGTIFAANVGCGIDENAYAFAYGKSESRRPVISCGVVLEGKQCYITKYE